MKVSHALLLAVPMCLASQDISAAERQQPRPEIFSDLLQCRSIAEDTLRLACFDRQVAAMETASQRDEVVVLDKTELNKTRRTLFGFSLPKLPFLNDGEEKKGQPEAEGTSQIVATIESVKSLGYGKWQIRLEDGAEWMTTDAVTYRDPRPGMKIEIKRASVGSFMGKIEGRAVRMKRIG